MYGDDAYVPKKGDGGFTDNPYTIYFYYIGPNPNGHPDVREYYRTGRELRHREDVESAVKELTVNARKPRGEQSPPPTNVFWKNMVWKRKSYIAILIDDPLFRFKRPGVIFDRDYGSLPNHSFYDAWDREIDIPTDDDQPSQCALVCFINHMKDAVGNDLDEREEHFHFDLYTEPPLRDRSQVLGERVVRPRYPDSGGTNMGPPIGPP